MLFDVKYFDCCRFQQTQRNLSDPELLIVTVADEPLKTNLSNRPKLSLKLHPFPSPERTGYRKSYLAGRDADHPWSPQGRALGRAGGSLSTTKLRPVYILTQTQLWSRPRQNLGACTARAAQPGPEEADAAVFDQLSLHVIPGPGLTLVELHACPCTNELY